MKSKKLLTLLAASSLLCFTACKKTSTATISDASTATTLSEDMAISDNISDDANGAFTTEADANSVAGARPTAITQGNGYCVYGVTIHDTAVTGNFANGGSKVITIGFDGSTCQNGNIIRLGAIRIVLTDSLRKAGSTATLTFLNYYVNGYRRDGRIIWTNIRTSPTANPEWTRDDSGRVTSPGNGAYWNVTGTRTVEETAGPNNLDTFTVLSGNRTVTNSAGVSATATVLSPLVAVVACPFLEDGRLQLTGPGGNSIVIDYGADTTIGGTLNHDAGCNDIATYSLNSGTEHIFYLGH